MSVVKVENIVKRYKKLEALSGVSLGVNEGEIFGIIGPDGAGKTSLFRILTTLILPSGGTAEVAGYDVVKDYGKIRKICGYMPGKFSLYQDLSVEENLEFFATLFNTTIQKNYRLIEDIYRQIEPFKDRKAGKLSGGMKQKLALCCALIHAPKVLFLDEPTTGVDPVSRMEFWNMLKKLQKRGITILVSTPYMDEAVLCDRIALIQNGKLLRTDTPEAIVESYDRRLWSVRSSGMHALLNDLRSCSSVNTVFSFGESFHVTVNDNAEMIELQRILESKGYSDIQIENIPATVEDCFMLLMENE